MCQYVFTMTAHPLGVNYMVMVQQRTALAATAAPMVLLLIVVRRSLYSVKQPRMY